MAGTLRNMRFFVAVYEEGSFTKAAARENATQPGVSHHIRQLEMAIDAALFTRHNGFVEATPAGRIFYDHCLKVIEAHDAALAAIRPFARARTERLTIGLVPSLTRRAITSALQAFMGTHPNVIVKIVEGHCASVVTMAAREELDFAIAQPMATGSALVATHLLGSPNFLVSRKSADRPNLRPFVAKVGLPLKLVWANASNPHRQMVERFVGEVQLDISSSLEVDSIPAMLDLVMSSDWQTILPRVMLVPEDLERFSLSTVTASCSLPLLLYRPAKRRLSLLSEELVEQIALSGRRIIDEWQHLVQKGHQDVALAAQTSLSRRSIEN